MTSEQFIKAIENTYAESVDIIKIKNKDYAGDVDPFKNFRLAQLLGIDVERAILLRVSDKLARMSNLVDKEPAVVAEKLEDTILDCIGYLAILKAYREKD